MNKIMQQLLAVTYPTLNINSLMEVVTATPNPELATEILCGLYDEPALPQKVKEKSGDKGELTLKSYDKWQDTVSYTYIKDKVMAGYFPKDTVKEEITLENFKARQQDWKSGAEQVNISIKTGESVIETSYCSLSTWLGYTNLD